MTRLLTCGWETGDVNESASSTTGSATQSAATSTPTPRTPGAYCLKIAPTAGNQTGTRQWILAASKTDLWVRFGIYLHGWGTSGTLNEAVFSVYDSAGTLQGCVAWSGADKKVRVYRGAASGTLLGTSTLLLTADAWHTMEIRWQITSTTVGIVEVWVDDTQYLNLTSIDNTNSTNANVQRVQLGTITGNNFLQVGDYVAFDDFAINDTAGTRNTGQIGDGRVVLLKPTGAGSNTSQTRGGTDSGANWSQCDELPPSLTDYVYSDVAGTRDTYALEDVPAGTWAVNAVEVLAYAQNSDSGTGSLGLTVKSGSTTNEGTAQNLAISAQYFRQLYETDPDTSSAWSVAAVSALEAGTTVR